MTDCTLVSMDGLKWFVEDCSKRGKVWLKLQPLNEFTKSEAIALVSHSPNGLVFKIESPTYTCPQCTKTVTDFPNVYGMVKCYSCHFAFEAFEIE